jgi:ribosomal-protein-serine acetyltransferase
MDVPLPVDIRIRPYAVTDVRALYTSVRASMPDLMPWMPWCHPGYAIAETRDWLEAQVAAFKEGTAFEFAIVSPKGQHLGACGLNGIDRAHRRANLGYWVRSDGCRRGVATAAVLLLRDWGFANTDLQRLEIVVAVENLASLRVAEKAGAAREGVLKDRLLLHDGPHDATVFSFTRSHPLPG